MEVPLRDADHHRDKTTIATRVVNPDVGAEAFLVEDPVIVVFEANADGARQKPIAIACIRRPLHESLTEIFCGLTKSFLEGAVPFAIQIPRGMTE
jgi:hypothetical protein